MQSILADLALEHDELDRLLDGISDREWDLPTPAEGWSVRDQVGHLAYFDEQAALAATDPEAFARSINDTAEQGDLMRLHLERGRESSPRELLEWWRSARRKLLRVMSTQDPDERLPWFGPPMRARSSVQARMMETWVHGHDIAQALGAEREPTDRLFHIADLGVKTFRFSFQNRGLDVPDGRVRVALRAPSGIVRVWNDEWDTSITGPVEEFVLVVAQRIHVDDTHLVLEGSLARRWMEVAQIFAGPPGPGRAPTAAVSG